MTSLQLVVAGADRSSIERVRSIVGPWCFKAGPFPDVQVAPADVRPWLDAGTVSVGAGREHLAA
jgi:hypothetical protein